MTSLIALDTSVAIPLLLSNHRAHVQVMRWWDAREVALSGHAAIETFSVLTRLPGDSRLAPEDAARLMADRFSPTLVLEEETTRHLPTRLAGLGVSGGAVYDAIVGLAAAQNGCRLATRDARARATYDLVGAGVDIVV